MVSSFLYFSEWTSPFPVKHLHHSSLYYINTNRVSLLSHFPNPSKSIYVLSFLPLIPLLLHFLLSSLLLRCHVLVIHTTVLPYTVLPSVCSNFSSTLVPLSLCLPTRTR